jgi:hypothetical protein
MKDIKRAGFAIAMGLSALLAGCGGGGGGSSSSSTANQSSLSADQQAFEQFALAPNAVYNLSWLLPLSGTPAPSTQYFVESHASMAASPSTAGTQALNGSTPTSIANTLSVPSTTSVSRYVINGAIVVGSGSQDSVSYQGTGVKVNALAADGVTVVDSVIRSGFSVVPLSGAVASAPADLAHWLNSLYFNPVAQHDGHMELGRRLREIHVNRSCRHLHGCRLRLYRNGHRNQHHNRHHPGSCSGRDDDRRVDGERWHFPGRRQHDLHAQQR